ncbi:MAG: master DNA invertase Mpi family serine-type recombinase, partial [Alphaproteobacteria bacterium]|nr:master DNA invertase Mpi family serine-type recombinase [Alphaproteobacteria bacterium]
MIYAYVRVSTDKQTLENQEFEIKKFCENENIQVDQWITETISGTKDFEKRKLGKLLKRLKSGDIIVSSEISRLGRNLLQIMTILNMCMKKEVQVWTIKDNYHLGADIQSKVLAFAFGLAAEIERNLISQRTKEALSRIKASGRKLGRQFGCKNKKHILDGKEKEISSLIEKG